jgi:hypothetical protein
VKPEEHHYPSYAHPPGAKKKLDDAAELVSWAQAIRTKSSEQSDKSSRNKKKKSRFDRSVDRKWR